MSSSDKARNSLEGVRERNQRFARKNSGARNSYSASVQNSTWRRETYCLPRKEAREKARAFLKKFPKAAYWSEVESWRVLEDDIIEFTMRRLPTAD